MSKEAQEGREVKGRKLGPQEVRSLLLPGVRVGVPFGESLKDMTAQLGGVGGVLPPLTS